MHNYICPNIAAAAAAAAAHAIFIFLFTLLSSKYFLVDLKCNPLFRSSFKHCVTCFKLCYHSIWSFKKNFLYFSILFFNV